MRIARLVMQDWWEKFSVKLKSASLEELLRAIYVDDGRMIMRKLQLGMRYVDGATEVFKFDEKWLAEDTDNGLSRDAVTLREVGNLMNSISPDLTFTTEIETDFSKGRLPTLAFELWSEKEGLRHSYFEKNMRSQLMTMKRSNQSEHSKFSILVNELSRRFEVLDDSIEIGEKVEIIDHYTQQLKNSGYTSDQILEIIVSGLKGIIRKEERWKSNSKRYRSI